MLRSLFLGGKGVLTEFGGKILKFGTEIEPVCGGDLFCGAHTTFHSAHTKQALRGKVAGSTEITAVILLFRCFRCASDEHVSLLTYILLDVYPKPTVNNN